jgi:predicted RNase H-like nuclease (RuvC/YqgF family)
MNIDDIIENAQLKGRIIALDAQVETLTAEVRCLEAVVRAHERVDCQAVANLKAEVARLDDELKMEKENEDRLVREFQTANNEVYGLQRQVAALIDNQTRLKAEVERLTKAGDAMLSEWSSGDEKDAKNFLKALAIWHAAKEGKQS